MGRERAHSPGSWDNYDLYELRETLLQETKCAGKYTFVVQVTIKGRARVRVEATVRFRVRPMARLIVGDGCKTGIRARVRVKRLRIKLRARGKVQHRGSGIRV